MNQPLWAIEYSPEARNYLYDSYPYTEAVMIAIEELRFNEDAVPPEGYPQIEPGVYLWEVLRHLILFQKLPDAQPQKCLWIGMVKPTRVSAICFAVLLLLNRGRLYDCHNEPLLVGCPVYDKGNPMPCL